MNDPLRDLELRSHRLRNLESVALICLMITFSLLLFVFMFLLLTEEPKGCSTRGKSEVLSSELRPELRPFSLESYQ